MPTSRALKPADGRPASYASHAAAALPTREGSQTKPARGHPGHPGPPKNPFEALAQGVRASTSQIPHLRAPVHNASTTNSANLNTGSNLPPHKRAPPVYASFQPSKVRLFAQNLAQPCLLASFAPKAVERQYDVAYRARSEFYNLTLLISHSPLSSVVLTETIVKSSTRSYVQDSQGSSVASLQKTPIASSNSTTTAKTPVARPSSVDELQDGTQASIYKPPKSMNSGFKDKSAANDSAFPCSYQNCDKGFYRAKDLKRHKIAEHEWCSNCDLDFEDDVALIEHRIASTLAGEGKHVACLKCGDDFGCEAGRKRHTQLVSRLIMSNHHSRNVCALSTDNAHD